MKLIVLGLVLIVASLEVLASTTACNSSICTGSCRCLAETSPIALDQTPQFVMLTFDDAVTVVNYQTYRDIFRTRKHKNGCDIRGTFFVCHEYTNYHLAHDLYRNGHEIAVHSITHVTNTDLWRNANETYWRTEMNGMKDLLAKYAHIKPEDILGVRVPFLQTSGNPTFKALKDGGFLYDSSMPARRTYYPYSMDYGFQQECQIQPCPSGDFTAPGLWEIPMVMYLRQAYNDQGAWIESTCAMADACIPVPQTENDAFEFLKANFEHHYNDNKAPFPLFLHEAWLQNQERKAGYLQFVDWLLKKDDVFLVTVKEVIDWLKEPVPLEHYKPRSCGYVAPSTPCTPRSSARDTYKGLSCEFKDLPQFWGSSRYMVVCERVCPKSYPWINNPLGN